MYNGDIGNVSGGGDIRWSRELAEKLDLADGKKDGVIKKNIWDGFLKSVGSNGNTVKYGITIERAMKSFEYYDKKKDVGKVDWGNWKDMYNSFMGIENPIGEGEEVVAHPPVAPPETDEQTTQVTSSGNDGDKVTQQKQADFEKAMQGVKFSDSVPTEEELNSDGYTKLYAEKRPYGTVAYANADGAKIEISDTRAGHMPGTIQDYTTTVKYTDSTGVVNSVTYDKDGKPIQGTLTMEQEDGTSVEYSYTFDAEGNKVLQSCVTTPTGGSEPAVDKRKKVEVTSDFVQNEDGTLTKTSLREDGKPGFKQTIDKNGTVLSESEFRLGKNEGKEIEIRRNYFEDGSIEKLTFVDGEQMDVADDGEMPRLGELQFKAKNSPLKIIDAKIPTESELLNAGYKKDSSMMTMNGGVIYRKEETGETVLISDGICEYSNGTIRQTHHFDQNGKFVNAEMSVKGKDGAFEAYTYGVDEETGDVRVTLSSIQPAIVSVSDYAMSAIDGHAENINALRQELEFPEGNFPDLRKLLINMGTGVGYVEKVSEDGKHKIAVTASPSGDIEVTFSEKQADGTYKTVGTAKMTKQESKTSLRGFDYRFESTNLKTGANKVISGANWDDFS